MFLFFLSVVLFLELMIFVLILRYQKKFQWLITEKDIAPKFPKKLVEKYMATSFDPAVGWSRKALTSGSDLSPEGNVVFTINSKGARANGEYDKQASSVCVFGDSYTFCRLVSDNETWPHHLSSKINTNVENYGVGNYGLDQAILRLERQIDSVEAKNIIIGVVPETIVRIHSYWKHYFEYGNILAFKPIYRKNKNGDFELKKTAVQSEKDFYRIIELLDEIQESDIFYNLKFKKDMLRFPFLYHAFNNRNRDVLLELIKGDLANSCDKSYENAFLHIIKRNYEYQEKLYENTEAVNLLKYLVNKYTSLCKMNNKKAILLVIPQPLDIEHARKGRLKYNDVYEGFKDIVNIVDMTKIFIDEDIKKIYKHGKLGAHMSNYGNKLIADYLSSNLVLN